MTFSTHWEQVFYFQYIHKILIKIGSLVKFSHISILFFSQILLRPGWVTLGWWKVPAQGRRWNQMIFKVPSHPRPFHAPVTVCRPLLPLPTFSGTSGDPWGHLGMFGKLSGMAENEERSTSSTSGLSKAGVARGEWNHGIGQNLNLN